MIEKKVNKWLVGSVLLLLGLCGVLSLLTVDFPIPEENLKLLSERFSPFQIKLLVLVNPTILLIMAALTGSLIYQTCGYSVPFIEGMLKGEKVLLQFKSIAVSGVLGGLIAGILMAGLAAICEPYLPRVLVEGSDESSMGILPRFLYGGITEEVLMRFGLMSLITWIFTLFSLQLKAPVYYVSIIISAALFGLGHFPMVFNLLSDPSSFTLLYILFANMLGGLIFGWLYWKKGLESAMIAHIFGHVVMLILS